MNDTGGINQFLKESTYENWLKELEKKTNLNYMKIIGWAPSITYFLIRKMIIK